MSRQPPPLQVVRPAPRASKVRASAGDASLSSTQRIVESITTAIVERRLAPGTKLAEQKIADIFKVSRTLVRQALNQLSRDRLITLEPARGARRTASGAGSPTRTRRSRARRCPTCSRSSSRARARRRSRT